MSPKQVAEVLENIFHKPYYLANILRRYTRAVFLNIFHRAEPRILQRTMNKTIDGLHMNEIYKSVVRVNGRAQF